MKNRKELILKEIVDQYIQTGEPIASKALLEEYDLDFSSATIRNEMNTLEKEEYIKKPYTSGGRIPTIKGYRYFVNWLIELAELRKEEKQEIINSYKFERQDANQLIKITASLLSNITGYLGFVLSPNLEEARLENVNLVSLDNDNVMAILVTEWGLLEGKTIKLEKAISAGELEEINIKLNQRLKGKKMMELRSLENLDLDQSGWYDKTIRDSLYLVKKVLAPSPRRRLHVEGILNLLERISPEESNDLVQLRKALRFLQEKKDLEDFTGDCVKEDAKINAMIGIGDSQEAMDYSIITKKLPECQMALGVLGPVRMDYSKTLSIVNYIGNRVGTLLSLGNLENTRN